jgi:uncharacterized protein YaeQ
VRFDLFGNPDNHRVNRSLGDAEARALFPGETSANRTGKTGNLHVLKNIALSFIPECTTLSISKAWERTITTTSIPMATMPVF